MKHKYETTTYDFFSKFIDESKRYELLELATDLEITNRHRMSKFELRSALNSELISYYLQSDSVTNTRFNLFNLCCDYIRKLETDDRITDINHQVKCVEKDACYYYGDHYTIKAPLDQFAVISVFSDETYAKCSQNKVAFTLQYRGKTVFEIIREKANK